MSYQLVLAETTVLETERLLLRPVTLADAEDMYDYASDEGTTRFVFETHASLEDTRENLATYFLSSPLGKYGICLKEKQRLIGTIDLRIDEPNCTAEMGYTLNRAYWGQGYTTEAGDKLIWLAFEKLKLNRVTAIHNSLNPASGRVMEKLGMEKEGVLKECAIFKGDVVTNVIYGITKKEYRKRQEK